MKKFSSILLGTFLFLGITTSAFGQTIKKGSWEKQNKSISGNFEIVAKDGGTYVVLGEDFKTKSAPDLKIFLSKKSISSITGKNATKDAVLVAKLKSAKGKQSYKIPSNVNLDDYASVLIHCEEYSIFWGGSSL